MSKRLSLLINDELEYNPIQKTTRTEVSDYQDRPEEDGFSRVVSIVNQEGESPHNGRKFMHFYEFQHDGPVYQFRPNCKRKFDIYVPEVKFYAPSSEKVLMSKTYIAKENICKEPPAPSHKSKAKVFVFPTGGQTTTNSLVSYYLVKQPGSMGNSAKESDKMDEETVRPYTPEISHIFVNRKPNLTIEELTAELYRCKREMMKKDAQIEMLEKVIKYNFISRERPSADYCQIIKYKDELNAYLMAKITELTASLKNKNQELVLYKYEYNKMECMVEAMNNDAYIANKQQHNSHLSKTFAPAVEKRQVSTHWEEEGMRISINKKSCNRQAEEALKKLEHIRNPISQRPLPSQTSNHLSINLAGNTLYDSSKSAINKKQKATTQAKEYVWYCQTSKNKPKGEKSVNLGGYFDFKPPVTKENVADGTGYRKKKKEREF